MAKKEITAITVGKLNNEHYEAVRVRIAQAAQVLPLPEDTDLDVWAARFVLMADGSVQRGLTLPWYLARHKAIEAMEGGRAEVVGIVAGLAVALLKNDPTLTIQEACFTAGDEWRASIRAQYDKRSGLAAPASLEGEAERVRSMGNANTGAGETMPGSVLARFGLVDYQPCDQEESTEDQRMEVLETLWSELTENQRTALDLLSGGMTYQAVADEMGLNSRTQVYQFVKLARRKIEKLISERNMAIA